MPFVASGIISIIAIPIAICPLRHVLKYFIQDDDIIDKQTLTNKKSLEQKGIVYVCTWSWLYTTMMIITLEKD